MGNPVGNWFKERYRDVKGVVDDGLDMAKGTVKVTTSALTLDFDGMAEGAKQVVGAATDIAVTVVKNTPVVAAANTLLDGKVDGLLEKADDVFDNAAGAAIDTTAASANAVKHGVTTTVEGLATGDLGMVASGVLEAGVGIAGLTPQAMMFNAAGAAVSSVVSDVIPGETGDVLGNIAGSVVGTRRVGEMALNAGMAAVSSGQPSDDPSKESGGAGKKAGNAAADMADAWKVGQAFGDGYNELTDGEKTGAPTTNSGTTSSDGQESLAGRISGGASVFKDHYDNYQDKLKDKGTDILVATGVVPEAAASMISDVHVDTYVIDIKEVMDNPGRPSMKGASAIANFGTSSPNVFKAIAQDEFKEHSGKAQQSEVGQEILGNLRTKVQDFFTNPFASQVKAPPGTSTDHSAANAEASTLAASEQSTLGATSPQQLEDMLIRQEEEALKNLSPQQAKERMLQKAEAQQSIRGALIASEQANVATARNSAEPPVVVQLDFSNKAAASQ